MNQYQSASNYRRLEDPAHITSPPPLRTISRSIRTHSINSDNNASCTLDVYENSNNYWKLLLLTGFFFGLPAYQYVMYQITSRDAGFVTNNECYFNLKCCHDFGYLYCFNNIASNIGYIVLGFVFNLIVLAVNRGKNRAIYYAVGLALVLEGIFSGLYHICPNRTDFQFDTSFMIIGTCLMILVYFQENTSQPIIDSFKLYTYFGFVVLLNAIELTHINNNENVGYWLFVFMLLIIGSIYASFNIYWGKDDWTLRMICGYTFRRDLRIFRDLVGLRFADRYRAVILGLMNVANLVLIWVSFAAAWHFSSVALGMYIMDLAIVQIGTLMEGTFSRRSNGRRRIALYTWGLFMATGVLWSVALYYFMIPCTDKFLTPQESQSLNKECVLAGYFDYHDIWHFVSSAAIFTMALNSYLT